MLRTVHEQVVPPNLTWNLLLELNCMVSENTNSMSLAKLTSLIVEVLCSWNSMKHSPIFLRSNQRRRKNNRMEGNIVLTHELIELHEFALPPIFIGFLEIVGCDWNVSDWSVEPNVKHLAFKLFKRNRNTPFQISSDALWFETHF